MEKFGSSVEGSITVPAEVKKAPVLWPMPNLEILEKQVKEDISKIKTWKDKALFYERILQSAQVTLFDPCTVNYEAICKYRDALQMAAFDAFDVEIKE